MLLRRMLGVTVKHDFSNDTPPPCGPFKWIIISTRSDRDVNDRVDHI